MAPIYKLTYFPFKGLGESIRYLLSYGEVQFEDERIPLEEWPTFKEGTPFGQVPLLEVIDKRAHQSIAILRYLAKKFKIAGKNDWEDLEIDEIVDTVNDFRSKVGAYFYETEEVAKAKRKEIIDTEVIPYYLDRFEAIAKANKGHLALGKLTWADLYFASLVGVFNYYSGGNMFSGRKNLEAVINNVENLPAIKTWIAKRPETDY